MALRLTPTDGFLFNALRTDTVGPFVTLPLVFIIGPGSCQSSVTGLPRVTKGGCYGNVPDALPFNSARHPEN